MDRSNLEANVAAHPFLIGMSAHHIRLLADCAMRTDSKRDQVIFREGETANRFYLIEAGKVVLESSADSEKAVTIDVIGDAELLSSGK